MSQAGDEEEEERRRKRAEDRRAMLEGPIEEGSEYLAPRGPHWAPEAGCCLFEAAGAVGMIAALVLPAWLLLR